MPPRPKQLHILSTPDGISDVFATLARGPLAIDTETTGLNWLYDRVGSINLAAGETAVFCYKDALRPAIRFLRDQVRARRELVFHHAKFDLHMLRATFGLHVPYPVHDTKIQSFLLDNRGASAYTGAPVRDHHLKSLARTFVDPDAREPEKELMKSIRANGGRHKGDWLLADEKLFGEYSALDPWYTLQLHDQFKDRIRHWPQPRGYPSLWSLYETEQWLLLALRDMEERGIMVRREFLEEFRATLKKQLDAAERKLVKLARGRTINWNSTPELRELLFSTLGIKPTKRTKTGLPATDEVTLVSMKHPIGAALIEYRGIFKQFSSYAESLLGKIGPDGAIHTTFNQDGAETGRLSSKEPNLQQQTRQSGVRKAYVPRKGLVLRFADYSQVEMRFAAHFAEEPMLLNGFNSDGDFDAHAATAQKMYGVETPTSEQRKFAKITNFTTLYGGGENQVYSKLKELLTIPEVMAGLQTQRYTLRPGEDPHRAMAVLIRERYFKQLPNMRRVTREEADIAQGRGFVMNAYGRHRYLEGEKWYRAFNTKIQGTAADQAKRGLVAIYRELQLGEGSVALLLQIHDEAVYESDGDPAVDRRVLELLAETERFKVPIIADMSGSSTSWQDKKKVEL